MEERCRVDDLLSVQPDLVDRFLAQYNSYRRTQFQQIPSEGPRANVVVARDVTTDDRRDFEFLSVADDEYRHQMERYLEAKRQGLSDEEIEQRGIGGATSYRAVEYTLAEAMAKRLAELYQPRPGRKVPTAVVLWANASHFPEPMFLPSPFEPSRTNLESAERLIANNFWKLVPSGRFDELFVFEHAVGAGRLREIRLPGAA